MKDLTQSQSLSLANIRESLIRQEDTIVFSLIERSQFAVNSPIYQASEELSVPGDMEGTCNS